MIDYRFHKEDDTYIVWIAGINRYIQLQEPAFRVFKQWAGGMDRSDIANSCSVLYSLPDDESTRFVSEIIAEVEVLFEVKTPQPKNCKDVDDKAQPPEYYSDHIYRIGNHYFRFIYRNEYLKNLIHPLFCHQEIKTESSEINVFELFNADDRDAYRVNDSEVHYFPVEEIDNFQGAVYMEILNTIHTMSLTNWMGVLHASAVSDGAGAVIFTAPSGSGKSSIALLLMANGFNILSDDFVPIALKRPEIYHFPAGISVKEGGIPFLKEYLPQIITKINESNETEIYLPPPEKNRLLANVPAKAIVFVNYDPDVDYNLKRESNLEVMNQLIKQSWIAGTPEAAECFLDWYFELPVYTLRYSNNRKAIEGIRGLLK